MPIGGGCGQGKGEDELRQWTAISEQTRDSGRISSECDLYRPSRECLRKTPDVKGERHGPDDPETI